MQLVIASVIPPEVLTALRERILALRYVDGTTTAGWHAKLVKHNLQADRQDERYAALNKEVAERFAQSAAFRAAARPRAMTPLLFSRYSGGMAYGTHVDDPVILNVRSDVSLTLALSDPETYDGGELVLETSAGELRHKLRAGDLLIYPSTLLHRVEPVTRGERLVAVGWVQSQVRDAHQREILYDLDRARAALFEKQGKTPEFDVFSKVSANLSRLWTEM